MMPSIDSNVSYPTFNKTEKKAVEIIEKRMRKNFKPLEDKELEQIGKKLCSRAERIKRFFIGLGKKDEKKITEGEFLKSKAITVIENINRKKIIDLFDKKIGKNDLENVLNQLQSNEVISSEHERKLKNLQEAFNFYKDVTVNQNLHWLGDFKELTNLEDLNPFSDKKILSTDEKIGRFEIFYNTAKYLDELNTKYGIKKNDFTGLLKFMTGNKSLQEIDFEDIALFNEALEVYKEIAKLTDEDVLKKTQKLFGRLKVIENDEFSTTESNEKLRSFLIAHPRVLNLLISLEFEGNSELINVVKTIQNHFEKTNSFPEQLSEAKTGADVLEMYREEAMDEGVVGKDEIVAKNPGEKSSQSTSLSEKKFGKALSTIPPRLISDGVRAELKQLQKDFQSSGQAELFIKLVDDYFKGIKFKNPKDVESKLNDFKKDKHPLNIYVTRRVAEKTREYLDLGIPLKELKSFQDEVVNFVVKAKGTEKIATKETRIKKIDDRFDQEVVKFNKSQLQAVRDKTKKNYGDDVADEFYNSLGDDVRSGKVHYLTVETTLSKREEISRLFVQFNIDYIEKQLGEAAANQAKNYLTNSDNKEVMSNPKFAERWNKNINAFVAIKQTWLEKEKISEEAFKTYLNRFVTENKTSELILEPNQVKEFEAFIRKDILEKLVTSFEKSYGLTFSKAVRGYLTEVEPEILSGEKSISESALFGGEVTLDEQISLLIPFFIENFKKYTVLDPEFVFEVLSEGVDMTPERFKTRSKNLERLATVIVPEKSLKNEQEKNFARELVKQIAKPYLMDFDLDNSEILTSQNKTLASKKQEILKKEAHLRESVGNIIKFCTNKFEQRKNYSDHVLAQAVKSELEESVFLKYPSNASDQKRLDVFADHTTDIRPKKISDGLNQKCMKFFIEEAVKEMCEEKKIPEETMVKFIRAFQDRILPTAERGMTTEKSKAYLLEILDLATSLPLNQSAKLTAFFNAIGTLDLNVINQKANHKNLKPPYLLDDIKADIIGRVSAARNSNMHPAVEILQENSFGVIQEFVPRLLSHFVSDENKNQVKKLGSSLSKLAPLYYESEYVKFGIEAGVPALSAFIKTSEFIADKAKIGENQTNLKALVFDNLNKIKDFDRSVLEGKTRAECREILKRKDHDLDLFEKVSSGLFDKFRDVHKSMYNPAAVKTGKDGTKEPRALETLVNKDLPKILKERKTIEKVLKNSVKYLSYISGKGGLFIVKKMLNIFLSSQMKKIDALDPATRKLILETINTGVTAGLLAGPELLNKHDISKYFDFLQGFVDFMKTPPEEMTEEKLDKFYFEVVSVLQQGVSEVTNYGEILNETIDETFNELNPHKE